MRSLAILASAIFLVGSGAEAQQRFQLERTERGIVRLDTETGALTLCREDGEGLTCRMAPDERAAYENELDLLERRVAALEERIGKAPPASGTGLPSEAEVDRSLSIMERFMRSFMGIVREFTGENKPQPDRT